MRIVNAVLAALLIFFAFLQLDDPDALLWMLIYGAAAIWPAMAFLAPDVLAGRRAIRTIGLIAIAACAVGFFSNAGTIGGDWIHVETAREALGYIIAATGIAIALFTCRPAREAGTS